jgi:hypothetical protein
MKYERSIYMKKICVSIDDEVSDKLNEYCSRFGLSKAAFLSNLLMNVKISTSGRDVYIGILKQLRNNGASLEKIVNSIDNSESPLRHDVSDALDDVRKTDSTLVKALEEKGKLWQ